MWEVGWITWVNWVFECPKDYSACGSKNYTINERYVNWEKRATYKSTWDRVVFAWDKNKNPLGAYLTDEVYNKGIEIFATKQEFFSEDSSLFDETLKTFVESHFKLTMLLSQNNKKMAIIYYNKGNTTKRLLIIGSKVIKDADQIYDLKVFTDRVEVSKRGNNQTIPIYLRGR